MKLFFGILPLTLLLACKSEQQAAAPAPTPAAAQPKPVAAPEGTSPTEGAAAGAPAPAAAPVSMDAQAGAPEGGVLWRFTEAAAGNTPKKSPVCTWRAGGKTTTVAIATTEKKVDDPLDATFAELTVRVTAETEGQKRPAVLLEELVPLMMGTSELKEETLRCRVDEKNRLLLSQEFFDIYSGNIPATIQRLLFSFDEKTNAPKKEASWKAEAVSDWEKIPEWAVFADNTGADIDAPKEMVQRLKRTAGPKAGKGRLARLDGETYLLLQDDDGLIGFVALSELPEPACRSPKRPERDAAWWVFEGADPVALQLTGTSADFWQYDKSLGCIASRLAFEAVYMEKGAEELLNLRRLIRSPEFKPAPNDTAPPENSLDWTWENTAHRLSDLHLIEKEVTDMKAGDPLEHRARFSAPGEEQFSLSWKGVTVSRGGRPWLDYQFSQERDFVAVDEEEYMEWHLYYAAALTVSRNKKGRLFYTINTQSSHVGDYQAEKGHTVVFTEDENGEPIKAAERSWTDGDYSSEAADEAPILIDNREVHRYYKTAFGTVTHHIRKQSKTIECHRDETGNPTEKGCPKIRKNILREWTFDTERRSFSLFKAGK